MRISDLFFIGKIERCQRKWKLLEEMWKEWLGHYGCTDRSHTLRSDWNLSNRCLPLPSACLRGNCLNWKGRNPSQWCNPHWLQINIIIIIDSSIRGQFLVLTILGNFVAHERRIVINIRTFCCRNTAWIERVSTISLNVWPAFKTTNL